MTIKMLKLYRKLDKILTKLDRQQQRLDSLNSVKSSTLDEIRRIQANCSHEFMKAGETTHFTSTFPNICYICGDKA